MNTNEYQILQQFFSFFKDKLITTVLYKSLKYIFKIFNLKIEFNTFTLIENDKQNVKWHAFTCIFVKIKT
jgi:hypothetical protein